MKKNNRKLAKIIAPVALATGCLGVLPATSCSKMYSNIKHIAPYLHEITYDDYREDTNYETIKEAEAFGCSSVRCGNFYGRNFDYVYNDTPEFIVHVKANEKKKRHGSLAVSTHFGLRENKMLAGKYDKQLELIPNLTMDGINDAGVICSSNVVSMESDCGKMVIPETRPGEGKKDLHVLFIPRFVLDNADSAEDAVNKLKEVNVMGNLNNHMYIHTMIADATSTYVVEFFKDKNSSHNHFDVIAEIKEEDSEETDGLPIMTNYFVNLQNQKVFVNDEKFGYERYEILKKGYQERGEDFDFNDMVDLMQRVKFSRAYEKENRDEKPFNKGGDLQKTEWYSENLKQSFITEWTEPEQQTDAWKEAYENLQKLKEAYTHKVREEANPAFWHTTHNSTYDIKNGILQVIVQEDYTHHYDYQIEFKK